MSQGFCGHAEAARIRQAAGATIDKKGRGFIEEVKVRDDIALLEVTYANRDGPQAAVLGLLDRPVSPGKLPLRLNYLTDRT